MDAPQDMLDILSPEVRLESIKHSIPANTILKRTHPNDRTGNAVPPPLFFRG
jgi:hypothetical protein